MQWVASTLHTTSEHGVSSITTADGAHLGCQQSTELTPPPGRFKWTRPFRPKNEIRFLRLCYHISTGLYLLHNLQREYGEYLQGLLFYMYLFYEKNTERRKMYIPSIRKAGLCGSTPSHFCRLPNGATAADPPQRQDCRPEVSWFEYRQGREVFFNTSRAVPGPTHPLIQWVAGGSFQG